MAQVEMWLLKWRKLMDFLATNQRRPSKFIHGPRKIRSWWKLNKKLLNAGKMNEDRVVLFKQLQQVAVASVKELVNTPA